MVLGNLPVSGRPTIWIRVGQGSTALEVGAGKGFFRHFYSRLSFFPFLWETARYRLKYCLKGPLDPKQPTNQPTKQFPAFKLHFIQTDCVFKEVIEISGRKPNQQKGYRWYRKRFLQLE